MCKYVIGSLGNRQIDGWKKGRKDRQIQMDVLFFSILSQEEPKYIFETKVRIQPIVK